MRAISRVTAPVCSPIVGLARVQQHHDLLERGVAGPLADPVDRALDLARAGPQAGERVGHRQPQVVVAVDRQHHVAQIRHQLVQRAQKVGVLVRHRVADRVGDVDRGRALVDRDLAHLGGELEVGPGGVHGRELDVVDVLLGVGHRRAGLALDVLARGLQLVLDVDVGGRDERVDARPLGVLDRIPGGVDVGHVRPGQAGDDRGTSVRIGAGDRLHRLEVARRGDREAGLDHVDAQPRQLLGDLQLLLRVQRDPRRLLAVTQRRVEDQYSVGVVRCWSWHSFLSSRTWLLLGAGVAATCGRRRAIPPGGGGEEVEGRGGAPSGGQSSTRGPSARR